MPKITKNEFLNNIDNIINEGMNTNPHEYDGTQLFNIHKYITDLIVEGQKNPGLMSYLIDYDNALKSGKKDFLLFESFGRGLARYAKGNKAVKDVITAMNETLNKYGNELQSYLIIEGINDPYANKVIKDAYNTYIAEPTRDTKDNLLEALDVLFKQDERTASKLHVLISENAANNIPFFDTYLNESEFIDLDKQINKSIEDEKIKKVQENIQNYAKQVFEEAEKEAQELKESMTFSNIINSNGIDLKGAIKKIVKTDAAKNEKLLTIVNEYAGALTQGAYEERLYETFIHNLKKFDYLVPVEEAITYVQENVKGKQLQIFITKTLEEMADSSSYFIIPLIEESCARFVKEPNSTNRVQLRQALSSFASNPYVFKIIEAIELDDSKGNNTLSEQAIDVKDKIKLIRQNATISNLYSPVQYIKENESVFNIRGQYYVKKGNNISKIDESYVNNLSQKFVELCNLVNDPSVVINEDVITLSENGLIAEIHEGYADINGIRESQQTLRDLTGMQIKYQDSDANFFIKCSCLLENFNNIADINFAKHVSLNENAHINFDLFNLGDHIFINAVNEDIGHSTFYRDVNPIQCKNIINNHMGINVASLFENLIPSQEKIIMKLNETQNEYQTNIDKLEETIAKAKDALKTCTTDEGKKKLEKAIKSADEKLSNLKKEYKEWQKDVKKVTGEPTEDEDIDDDDEASDDGGTREETTDEPLTDKEVKDEEVKDELSTPITSDNTVEDGNTEDEEVSNTDDFDDDFTVTDDEFASYLGDETTDEISSDNDDDSTVGTESTEDSDETETSDDDDNFDFNTATEDTEDEYDFNADADIDIMQTRLDDDQDDTVEDDTVETNVIDTENSYEINPDESTDIFLGDDDTTVEDDITPEVNTTDIEETVTVDRDAYTIADVLWNENFKTGEKYKSGTVSIVVPMISGDGRLYTDNKTYEFYLGTDNKPIIDNEEMTVDLYKAIMDAIVNSPSYAEFKETGIDDPEHVENNNNDDTCVNGDDCKTITNDEVTPILIEPTTDNTSDDTDDTFVYTDDIEDNTVDTDVTDDSEDVIDFGHIFDITDSDDEFSVTLNNDSDDVESSDETPADTEVEITTEEEPNTEEFTIPTYTDGETEYEFPAANVDDTEIPEITLDDVTEDAEVTTPEVQKKDKSLIKVKPVYTTEKKDFFVNEGKATPSKIKASSKETSTGDLLIEDYNIEADADVLQVMHDKAVKDRKVLLSDCITIQVSNIEDFMDIKYFTIETEKTSYTVYRIGNNIYYRKSSEFYQILQDISDSVPGVGINTLTVNFTSDEPIDYVSALNIHDCLFLISTIISTYTGMVPNSNMYKSVQESIKIKKPKLSNDHDFNKSKMKDDILYGDADKREFEEEVEKTAEKEGIENPLLPAGEKEEESVKPKLPNVHNITESKKVLKNEKHQFFYEPMDKVIYKGVKSQVLSVSEDGNLINILTPQGQLEVNVNDLEPDTEYVNPLRNVPKQFDFDKDNLTTDLTNAESGKMKDLNGKTVDCNIIVDNFQLNLTECKASLDDIINSKRDIRVINENGVIETFDVNNLAFIETPYAVVVGEDDKPLRSIQVYADSYINAGPDELVLCKIDGKDTKYPKSKIKILS